MRLLLDTHVLLWWLADDRKLRRGIRTLIADGSNEVFVSAVTIAEIAIKQSLGKLDAPTNLVPFLAEEGFSELPLSFEHAATLAALPWHHRDPFDRMLVAQAIASNLTFATHDASISDYAVELVTG